MKWVGSAVGAAVGGIFGGPVGAVLGAAIGAGAAEQYSAPEIAMELQWMDDHVGRGIRLIPQVGLPGEAACFVRLQSRGGQWVRGTAPFEDDDGDFLLVAEVLDGVATAFLPFGAIRRGRREPLLLVVCLVVAADGGFRELGYSSFDIDLPDRGGLQLVDVAEPLLQLAMLVARADGLDQAEVRQVREVAYELGVDPREDRALHALLKEAVPTGIATLVERCSLRLPHLPPFAVLSALAAVSLVDGAPSIGQIDLIRDVAILLGMPSHQWSEVMEELGLRQSARSTEWALELLGLAGSPSPEVVKAAYRRMMRDYHPDRVATLPPEFQRVAHDKVIEIQEAYAILCQPR